MLSQQISPNKFSKDSVQHCVKTVHIWRYSGPHFPAFGLNSERQEVSLRIRSECGKIWTRITPNTETLQADDRNPAWIDEKIKKIVLQKNRAYSTYS